MNELVGGAGRHAIIRHDVFRHRLAEIATAVCRGVICLRFLLRAQIDFFDNIRIAFFVTAIVWFAGANLPQFRSRVFEPASSMSGSVRAPRPLRQKKKTVLLVKVFWCFSTMFRDFHGGLVEDVGGENM